MFGNKKLKQEIALLHLEIDTMLGVLKQFGELTDMLCKQHAELIVIVQGLSINDETLVDKVAIIQKILIDNDIAQYIEKSDMH